MEMNNQNKLKNGDTFHDATYSGDPSSRYSRSTMGISSSTSKSDKQLIIKTCMTGPTGLVEYHPLGCTEKASFIPYS